MFRKWKIIKSTPVLLRIEVSREIRRAFSRALGLILFGALALFLAFLVMNGFDPTIIDRLRERQVQWLLVVLVGVPLVILGCLVPPTLPHPLLVTEKGVTWGALSSWYWKEIKDYSLSHPLTFIPILSISSTRFIDRFTPSYASCIRITAQDADRIQKIFEQKGVRTRT